MRKILSIITLLQGLLLAAYPEAKNDEELLFARRIIEFWRDQDRTFIQPQIEVFLKTYPDSEFIDHFQAMLGDLALENKQFTTALAAYSLIKQPDVSKSVRMKRWHALYQLKNYEQLYYEIGPQVALLQEEEGKFYYAEAALRLALTLLEHPEQELRYHQLFQEALALYKSLQHSERFSGQAQLAMAEIHRHLGQVDQAAKLYLTIAQEQKSPHILYHAATLLTRCDVPKAIELFARLTKGGGTHAADAAYQWLCLLVQTKQWEVLKQEKRSFLSTLEACHLPMYYFYLGILVYEAHVFEEVCEPLQKSLSLGLKPPYDQDALLALMHASKEIGAVGTAEYAYGLLKERYPDRLEEVAFARAVCYRKAHRIKQALAHFSDLIMMAEKPATLEAAYLEAIDLWMEQKTWGAAHRLTQEFLEKFPLSLQKGTMLKLAVELSLADLNTTQCYEQLASDLERALHCPGLYKTQEILTQHLLLAKCYIYLDQPQRAVMGLQPLSELGEQNAEWHYLLAIGLLQSQGCLEKIAAHGEKALILDPHFYDKDRLHLYLFNSYLELSRTKDDPYLTEHAAEHLYAVLDLLPISLDNQLWLAHTYAQKPAYQLRARRILENIILGNEERLSQFSEEAFLLASLYDQACLYTQALHLLEPLYTYHSTVETALLLATTYKHVKQYDQAISLFSHLESVHDTRVALLAKLERLRILAESLVQDGDSHIILDSMKSIWIQKSLSSEPIHLEAALDYLHYHEKFYPTTPQLALLRSIKEHFTQERDIYSKDYHEQRRLQPERDLLYQSYMRLLDAYICLAEAHELKLSPQQIESRKKAAHALLTTLVQGKYATTAYIIRKASLEVQ